MIMDKNYTCDGCPRDDLIWSDFYWHANRSGTKSKDRFCKPCRGKYFRSRFDDKRVKPVLTEEQIEAKQIQAHIDEMEGYVAAGTMRDAEAVFRASRTLKGLRTRLRDLAPEPRYNPNEFVTP